MQNGGFGWASSLSSSLAAQKVSWSGVGYQTSLSDLFLKKTPLHQFNTGISQLAVASSYLEKMSNFSGSSSDPHAGEHHDSHASHQSHHQHSHHQQQHHPQQQTQMKCPHPESKNKPGQPCELCQEYQTLCIPNPGPKNLASGDSSNQSNLDKSLHAQSSLHHHHLQSQAGHGSSAVNLQHLPNSNNIGAGGMNLLQSSISLARRNSSSTSNCPRNNNSTSRSGNSSSTANNKTFLCPVCHRNFTQKGNLKTHMMIHSGDKPYSCQVCGKCFTQKGNVDTHMKIHTGEKDQNCQLCGKRFTQRGNLRTHMRSVHTKEKPHGCTICGKAFSQKGNMMTHLRTHNKEDRFPCTICGKTFSQKGNLKTHMQRHSGTLPARRYGPRAKKSQAAAAAGGVAAGGSGPHFAGGNPSTSRETVVRSNLKSADDDSASSLDHRSSQEPGASQLSSHDVVHLAKQHQQVLDANQHLLNQHRTAASSAAAQMGMQFSPRFYPPSSTITAPLAHTASWLAAAGAGIAGPKGRMAAPPYDSFTLTSYAAGFQHPSHLGRLSLLNAPPSHHVDHSGNHEDQIIASHHKSSSSRGTASSTGTTSGSSNPTNQSSHTSHEYSSQQTQPNPDFSQLLD